jgi:hypothetical protein
MAKDIVGIFMGLVIVAGLLVMVKNGTGTAGVLNASANGFANDIKAATGQG